MSGEPEKNQSRKRMGNQTIDALSLEETTQIVHDLHIHQAELEARNEEPWKTQTEATKLRRDYADLFDVTPIGLFIFGQKGRIEKVNRFGASMFGIDKQLTERKPFIAFVAAEFAAAFLDHLRQADSTKKRQILELRLKRFGGDTFLAECDTTPVYDQGGKFLYLRTVITDMTNRKQSTEALLQKLPRQ
jgi:PAS domain S-box-containing protein